MFEKASRAKLRFDTDRGSITVEDLWDLPLTSQTGKLNLDGIAVALFGQLKAESTVSFVNTPATANESVQLKFNIVKHIIDVRLAENAAKAQERNNAEKKQAILALIARKETDKLEENSLEDLRKMVDELG